MISEIATFYVGTKLVFGNGSSNQAGAELASLGVKKAMVVTDKGVIAAGLLKGILESMSAAGVEYFIFDEVPPNPPRSIVVKGLQLYRANGCDGFIAVGGGSSMDACKAISIMTANDGDVIEYDNSELGGKKFKNKGAPVITVPTTSGTGSEVTQWSVITDEKRNWKSSIGSPLMSPTVALVDPLLTLGLPPSITAATGVDALTHAIEAYTTKAAIRGGSPVTDALALDAIRLIGANLRQAYAQGYNVEARKNMMIGSTMAGLAFPQIGLGTCHGMAHPLGGHYDVPHGVANAILLPHIMKFNLMTCPDRFRNIAIALGENVEGLTLMEAAEKAVTAVKKLCRDLQIPSLKTFNIDPASLPRLAEDAVKEAATKDNPRNTSVQDAIDLFTKALNDE
jgi:alcohol dehydrogenase class IV